ncbi:MAG: hypothetical protein LQ351_007901 [Letrouitia transgressa]|nr:MAG: hypothetical protein LQ351_007901 [Letrouitia transgressa]
MLLERLICLLPRSLDEKWWSLDDVWNVELWYIHPQIQVCGIGDDGIVMLDGARGAAIRWDKFVPVLTLGQESLRARLARWVLRSAPGPSVIGIIWIIINSAVLGHDGHFDLKHPHGGTFASSVALLSGILLVVSSSLVVILSPYLIRLIYRTDFHDSQPFFFGIEGYVELYDLEILILGSNERRLRWSMASSPFSRHALDRQSMKADFFSEAKPEQIHDLLEQENMAAGLYPVKNDPDIEELVEKAKSSTELEKKIFTLVDTYTMAVTL